jgi:hypothetical protein
MIMEKMDELMMYLEEPFLVECDKSGKMKKMEKQGTLALKYLFQIGAN